jgi:hypothetical protein
MITPLQAIKRRGVSLKYPRFSGIYSAFYASNLANACPSFLSRNRAAMAPVGSSTVRSGLELLIGSRRIFRFESDCSDDAIGFLQHFAGVVPVNGDCCIADRGSQEIGKLIDVRFEALALCVDGRMCF